MIKIVGLRDYKYKGIVRKKDTFYKHKWGASSVKELFANLETIMEAIPEGERYNLYYTASKCFEDKKRELREQSIIPIDIDGIDLTQIESYIDPVLEVIGRTRANTGIIASGNGLQFVIGIDKPITYEEYFEEEENKKWYKALLGTIACKLLDAGLPCTMDSTVFSKSRLLRLPLTENRKYKRINELDTEKTLVIKQATFIARNVDYLPFDLEKVACLPEFDPKDHFSNTHTAPYAKPDSKAVQEECLFLNWAKANQSAVSEPLWYAMLSIVGRLENGAELVHEYSNKHPDYNSHHTDLKTKQALENAGPRLCNSIAMEWDGCVECPHFGVCNSPITLKGEDHLVTQSTGFYTIPIDPITREQKKGIPNYNDLMKFFDREHKFKTVMDEDRTIIYDKTHWKMITKVEISNFAETHFNPKPTETMRKEFRCKVGCNHLTKASWLTPSDMINFANGVLELKDMTFHPHSHKYGFKYVLPFNFDNTATTNRFDRFMTEITCGDLDMQTLLLEFMGYSLSGHDASFAQKALILIGEGSNGKSVLLDLLGHMAGDGNYSALSMGAELNKIENREQLDGKLFNISEETPTNAMMSNTTFKSLVSGGTVQVRRLYCQPYPMKNNAKIILACNKLPPTKDLSHGMFRRLLIVPFNATFSDKDADFDPLILDKLKLESTGIFNKILRAYLAFVERGKFTVCKAIDLKIDDYRQETNAVNVDTAVDWWTNRVVVDEESTKLAAGDLYLRYSMEIELEGCRPLSRYEFFARVKELIPEGSRTRLRIDGKVQVCYTGIRLATKEDDDE